MQAPSKRQELEQERAAQTWEDIQRVDKSDLDGGKYRTLTRSTPALIQSSGLGQTLAFLLARGTPEHKRLYADLSNWVLGKVGQGKQAQDGLLGWVVQQDTPSYRRATQEAMSYLGWLKRFAEAVLPEPKEDKSHD